MNMSLAIMIKQGGLAALLLATAQLAFAHAHPAQQTPAPDATVEAPHEVAIDFTEGLEPAFSKLNVVDAAGKQVQRAKASRSAISRRAPIKWNGQRWPTTAIARKAITCST